MNEISTPIRRQLEQINACEDVASLAKQLEEAGKGTLENIVVIGACMRRLRELGAEVQLGAWWYPYAERVANGQIDPRLVLTLLGCQRFLNIAAQLPLPDQARIAANEPIKLMTANGDHRMVQPLSMVKEEIDQVFEAGRIRSDAEQVGWIKARDDRRKAAASIETNLKDVYEILKNGVKIGGVFVSKPQLKRILAQIG